MKDYLRNLIKGQQNQLLKRSTAREYLQARILQVFQEKGAFLNVAFLGGTSLRFLYSIPRYSEDLDFSLLPSKNIDFAKMLDGLRKNFEAENYEVVVTSIKGNNVLSSFIKFPSLLYEFDLSAHQDEVISIKLEIDTNPPPGENTETTIIRKYVTLNLLHYDKASLFAGKIHAILERKYTKGRDLFDLVWMLSNPSWPQPNLLLLNNALRQTGWKGAEIESGNWKEILLSNVEKKDWKSASGDVMPFLEREGDRYLLTFENCKMLLDKFKN